jgi:SAM-dependent methyltransferase
MDNGKAGRVSLPDNPDYICAVEDERFDHIYPTEVRDLSSRHWTPVAVARTAAEFLVKDSKTRVLDLGCGPGKFCIVGALTTAGHFTGVEQRRELANVARSVIPRERISNVEIVNANITEIDFTSFDAFYLFNPFEENLFKFGKIDSSVQLSKSLYERYTRHVATQLTRAPLGTRLATYHGFCEEVPLCYECQQSSFDGVLKLWQKTRDCPTKDPSQDAQANRNRWRFLVDFASQQRELRAAFLESETSSALARPGAGDLSFVSHSPRAGKMRAR